MKEHLKNFTPKSGTKAGLKLDMRGSGNTINPGKNAQADNSYTKDKEKNINIDLHKFRNNFFKNNSSNKQVQIHGKEIITGTSKVASFTNSSFYNKGVTSSKGVNGHTVSLADSSSQAN